MAMTQKFSFVWMWLKTAKNKTKR